LSEGSELLTRLLSSEVKGDLLVMFHKNPGIMDTMDGVARRIGRTASVVETDVEDLVKLGLLRKKRIGKLEVVLWNREVDKRIQESIAEHVRGLEKG
jgi:predicted transcriptional regulator